MTFKKNRLSIVIWIPFALVICAVYGLALYQALVQVPMLANSYVRIGLAVVTLGLAAGIFVGIKKLSGIKTMQKQLLLEALCFAVLLGVGVFLRCYFLYNTGEGTDYFQEAAYFETAKVTGSGITPIAHGIQYFYVVLLRGLFFLFGNHFFAGIVLQIVLQSAAVLVWYSVIRKMTGAVAALTFLAGMMLLPQSIKSGLVYSPKYLYLLMAGVVFLVIAGLLKREYILKPLKWYSYITTFLAGIGLGLLVYLDVTGLIFFVPILALGFVSQKEGTETMELKKKVSRILLQTVTVIVGFGLAAILFLYIDAMQSGSTIKEVFSAWCALFRYKGLGTLPTIFLYEQAQWIHVGILFLLVLGVPAFFVRKKKEMQLVWAFMLTVAGLIHAGGFYAQGMNCDLLLLVLVLALTGAGLQALLSKEIPVEKSAVEMFEETEQTDDSVEVAATPTESEELKETEVSVESEESKKKEVLAEDEGLEETETVTENKATKETKQETKPRFIENPLPLPKKHVKKTMGYRLEVSEEQMKYDIEVSDTDDFDI
ncbi:MAG: hypothetical protein J6B90_10920 [Lachnospiraceae bacterium]|nr:hypothetical protein [Lachnospiraceae bacterium]